MNLSLKIGALIAMKWHYLLINSAIFEHFWRLHELNANMLCCFLGKKSPKLKIVARESESEDWSFNCHEMGLLIDKFSYFRTFLAIT